VGKDLGEKRRTGEEEGTEFFLIIIKARASPADQLPTIVPLHYM
jgi:hypothetical protein